MTNDEMLGQISKRDEYLTELIGRLERQNRTQSDQIGNLLVRVEAVEARLDMTPCLVEVVADGSMTIVCTEGFDAAGKKG